ncbi:hypothetical protein R3W88_011561 [Solanum pinnatisectum]|uniref:Uncharacterized protein n=1 Tax=Solanum pinnatisectum TaxID=50273 RepID=A0AAV9L791_9SOLN|nr:hypothetical protein R3W88_011561 [Solanum pinnatisectum]
MGRRRAAPPQGNFGAHQDVHITLGLTSNWRSPCTRHFYDEVVPSAKELTQIDTQSELLLPKSYRYMLSAFYRLAKDDLHEPRLNHNPSGHIDSNFLLRIDEENAPFVELDVEESLRDETNFVRAL